MTYMTNEALRLFRVFHDFKLYEMAEKLEISTSYLSEIEKGKKTISLKLLNKYSEIFNVKPSLILAFSEELNKEKKSIKGLLAIKFIKFLQDIENAANS